MTPATGGVLSCGLSIANATKHEFKELLDIRKLPGEDEATFATVGGFVMTSLGKVAA